MSSLSLSSLVSRSLSSFSLSSLVPCHLLRRFWSLVSVPRVPRRLSSLVSRPSFLVGLVPRLSSSCLSLSPALLSLVPRLCLSSLVCALVSPRRPLSSRLPATALLSALSFGGSVSRLIWSVDRRSVIGRSLISPPTCRPPCVSVLHLPYVPCLPPCSLPSQENKSEEDSDEQSADDPMLATSVVGGRLVQGLMSTTVPPYTKALISLHSHSLLSGSPVSP